MQIIHDEYGYTKPTEIISQHHWPLTQQVANFGHISDNEATAEDKLDQFTQEYIVAIFRIKYKH